MVLKARAAEEDIEEMDREQYSTEVLTVLREIANKIPKESSNADVIKAIHEIQQTFPEINIFGQLKPVIVAIQGQSVSIVQALRNIEERIAQSGNVTSSHLKELHKQGAPDISLLVKELKAGLTSLSQIKQPDNRQLLEDINKNLKAVLEALSKIDTRPREYQIERNAANLISSVIPKY